MFSGMANALPVWMGFSLADSSLKGMTRLGICMWDPSTEGLGRVIQSSWQALFKEIRRRKKRQFGG